MVEFVTLLLGLVVGPQTVEVAVGERVATVELLLDSRPVATLDGPPWQVVCDLGPRLVPQELVAVARGPDGRELGRASQWINMPSPRAEARLVLEREGRGPPRRARLVWEAFDHERPATVTVTLDGEPLPADDPEAIALPPTDPDEIHILAAELEFSDTVRARAESVFGGVYGEDVASELTAVVLETDRRRLPRAEALAGRLTSGGRPLRVAAVERGPLELLVVREEAAATFAGLERLEVEGLARAEIRSGVAGARRMSRSFRLPRFLGPRDRVHFVFPTPDPDPDPEAPTGEFDFLPVSENIRRPEANTLFRILTAVTFAGHHFPVERQRIADAVAVAGLEAATGNRRRAVLLILSGESTDVSRLRPAAVRDYLNSLTVPLFVWSLPAPERAAAVAAWGEADPIGEWSGLVEAIGRLKRSLERQAVVWVAGRHPPHRIALDPALGGLRLARRASPELAAQVAALPRGPLPPPPAPTDAPSDTPAAVGKRQVAADLARRIAQARGHLGPEQTVGTLGELQLLTDHRAPRLLKSLDRLARETPRLYREHHGLSPAADGLGTVVLFRDEEAYRALERELGAAQLDRAGHTSPGLVTLFAGKRDQREVEATFVHELVHLLNFRALGAEPPPWLDEGLAEEMALARIGPRGELDFGPLDSRALGRGGRVALYGPLTVLDELIAALDRGALPPLPELLELDREGFRRAPERRLLYALFGLWVHYLASADEETAAGFRTFLAGVAGGGGGCGESLTAALGRGWDELEPGFRRWLAALAERLRPPVRSLGVRPR